MHQPGEPSVEEILDSIKKVIARDNRDEVIAERRRKASPVQQMAEPADAEESDFDPPSDGGEPSKELAVSG